MAGSERVQEAANVPENTGEMRLAHLPVSLFSIVMGVSGLAIAWQKASAMFGVPCVIWQIIGGLAGAIFIVLAFAYGAKLLRYPQAVAGEWKHPVRVNFFPAISIGLLLQAVVWLETFPLLSFALWLVGTLVQFGFTVFILSSWMYHTHYDIKHANPAWFIPVVGNLFVPIVGVKFASPEISWFYFSVGIVFWVVLMTIVLYRVFFHDPIPSKLLPTLFIFIAPPAVGFIAYSGLVPEVDGFSRVLYYTALFLFLLLGVNARRFLQVGFYVSAWAYSFPLAAMTIATLLMAKRSGVTVFNGLGVALLGLVSVVVTVLIFKTLGAIRRKAICVPE
ncbi:SLAC1 anion channel family protein [Propionivibrio limicola]|uniref:SLAC1 anion channel family protein n=1 Tax=Propionivibrio limicola TaxID=167645 RepID=UPI001B860BB8|nr:SLAC1 anion channel family protein [Propionivibrio limicola]